MRREYKVGPRNSTVCGYPGRDYDWSQACWDGSAVYVDDCGAVTGHPKQELKAPRPYTDNGFIAPKCEYIHVPWYWERQCTMYRVRPNESMYAGMRYRGLRVKRQTAIEKADGWYWVLEGE